MRPALERPVTYTITARNTATASENRIHDDAVAREYGFSGGLVPGAVIYEHLCHPVVSAWGRHWLSSGSMTARFLKPVYDGDAITIEPGPLQQTSPGPEVELRAVNRDGVTCALATAGFAAATATLPLVGAYAPSPLPNPPPPASVAAFRAAPALASVPATLEPAAADEYMREIGEDLDIYRGEGLVPSGHFVSCANRLLAANVRLGPWIHVSSEVMHFAPAVQGQPLTIRGRVAALYERKGHRFVEIDGLVVGPDRRPVAQLHHIAIYEPRKDR